MIRKELIAIVFLSAMYFGLYLSTSVFAYQLPDTGQHTCYDDQGNEITCPSPGEPFYGQDAQYQGPEPAYQDNGDDKLTNLKTMSNEPVSIKWIYEFGTYPDTFTSSPALAKDGTVFIGAGKYLLAIDSDGNLKWKAKFDCNIIGVRS